MAVIEKIGEELNLEFLDEVLSVYGALDFQRLRLKDMKHLTLLVKCSIQLGLEEEGKELEVSDAEIKNWIFKNINQVTTCINDFAVSLSGNVEAPQAGAKKPKAVKTV